MSLDADLATAAALVADRRHLSVYDRSQVLRAMSDAEAEIARLERERETWVRIADGLGLKTIPAIAERLTEWCERAEAAERREARLREGLRREIEAYPTLYEGLRALLAEDGAAECEHNYIFKADEVYECDRCGGFSSDGVHPRIGGAA